MHKCLSNKWEETFKLLKVHQASKALIPFFNHVFKEEWQQAEELRLTIRNLERGSQ